MIGTVVALLDRVVGMYEAGEDYRFIAGVLSDACADSDMPAEAARWAEVRDGVQHIDRVTADEVVLTTGWRPTPGRAVPRERPGPRPGVPGAGSRGVRPVVG